MFLKVFFFHPFFPYAEVWCTGWLMPLTANALQYQRWSEVECERSSQTHPSSEFQQTFPHDLESAVIDTFWQSLAINSHTAPQRLFMFEHLVKLPTSLGTMWEALKREKSKATTQRVFLLVNHALVYLTWRVSVRAQLSELFYSIIMP